MTKNISIFMAISFWTLPTYSRPAVTKEKDK